jgi:dihydroxyacetone kinase
MRKLVNNSLSVVYEMLEGSMAPAPGQALLSDKMVVIRAKLPETGRRSVAVISGRAQRP